MEFCPVTLGNAPCLEIGELGIIAQAPVDEDLGEDGMLRLNWNPQEAVGGVLTGGRDEEGRVCLPIQVLEASERVPEDHRVDRAAAEEGLRLRKVARVLNRVRSNAIDHKVDSLSHVL